MGSNISDELRLAKTKAQYDEYAKRLLSNKIVLAWILKNTTEEFCDIPLEQIAGKCIGDDVEISKVRVRPGETNVSGDVEEQPGRVLGDRTEDKVPGEGAVFYDIRVSAYAPEGDKPMKILVNVEAQKDFYVGYAFVTRGIFYGARMISAQMDTEFTSDNYSKLKKVYSIWICMNAPDYIGNAISKYSMHKEDILKGIPDIKKDYDKLGVVVVCLNRKKYYEDSSKGLTGFLNTLLATDMDSATKEKILSEDYGINISNNLSKETRHMCNLAEGIWERGMERGGLLKAVSVIRRMLLKGMSCEEMIDILGEDIEVVNKIADKLTQDATVTDREIVEELFD